MTDWKIRIREEILDAVAVRQFCEYLVDESVDVLDRANALEALHDRGETAAEIAEFVRIYLEKAMDPKIDSTDFTIPLVDVCGTGGDSRNLFNVSTAVMFVVAGAGAGVVKHGNRSITSRCGGADVLETLGISVRMMPDKAASILHEAGCVFLFAPDYHPGFRQIAPIRKLLAERGQRSIFNILGPLLNPVRPPFQLAGVFSKNLPMLYAEALGRLGRKRAWVVHGGGGEDEMSVDSSTQVAEWYQNAVRKFEVHAGQFGLETSYPANLVGRDAETNAKIILGVLQGEFNDIRRDIVLLNAAATLVVCGIAKGLEEGLERSRESILSGAAMHSLRTLQKIAPWE